MKRVAAPLLIVLAVTAGAILHHPNKSRSYPSDSRPGVYEMPEAHLANGSPNEPESPWRQRYRQWLLSGDPANQLREIRFEYERHRAEQALLSEHPADAIPAWVSLGPTDGAGKINAVAFPPNDSQTVYAGADGGGVWKSTDAGSSWTPLTDSIPNLEVGALAIVPSSPNIIYLGTGILLGGIGLLKSNDGGATWTLPDTVLARYIYRISVHPTNPAELVIGTSSGGFRSTDGGSSWTPVIPFDPYGTVYDLVRNPAVPQILYTTATHCCKSTNGPPLVLKSLDSGVTWTEEANGPGLSSVTNSRMAIAISPSMPQVLYVTSDGFDGLSHVFKSTDAGQSWTDLVSLTSNPDYTISHFLAAFNKDQSFRNNAIVVSPTDPNTVMAAGVAYARSTDGGLTWQTPPFRGTTMHPDAVVLTYHGSTLFLGGDGGLWSSPDNGQSATPSNLGLVTRQYNTVASDPSDPVRFLAGSQDNGTDVRQTSSPASFAQVTGGDGFDCAINPNNPSIAYTSFQFGHILRSNTGTAPGALWQEITPPYDQSERTGFSTVLRMDPITPTTLYTTGNRVWRTSDGGDSWQPLPTTTTDGSAFNMNSNPVFDLAIGRSNTQVLMIPAPSTMGAVLRSTNGGNSWTPSTLVVGFIDYVEIDPSNANIAYAVTQVIDASGALPFKVYKTTDGAVSWQAVGAGLPSSFLFRVRIDPKDSNILYCGTSAGIYRSIDQGASWAKFGFGLPNVPALDFAFSSDDSLMRVATFGRGVWEIPVQPSPLVPVILLASADGRRLIVTGRNFNIGATIIRDGVDQATANDTDNPRTVLIAKKGAKKLAPGSTVSLQVRNSDGTLSPSFSFMRPAG